MKQRPHNVPDTLSTFISPKFSLPCTYLHSAYQPLRSFELTTEGSIGWISSIGLVLYNST